jgi:quinol-cytochrome oxidoreductase complex cytochrome b subunit
MTREIVYSFVGCILMEVLSGIVLVTVTSFNLLHLDDSPHLLFLIVPGIIGIVVGFYFGKWLDVRMKQKPLNRKNDSGLAGKFVLFIMILALITNITLGHPNLISCIISIIIIVLFFYSMISFGKQK